MSTLKYIKMCGLKYIRFILRKNKIKINASEISFLLRNET